MRAAADELSHDVLVGDFAYNEPRRDDGIRLAMELPAKIRAQNSHYHEPRKRSGIVEYDATG